LKGHEKKEHQSYQHFSKLLWGEYPMAINNYTQELLLLLPKYKGTRKDGDAIQDANLVLGRIAVREGNIEAAKNYLIAAGKSPGSPVMDSFGPNMTLAKDLLEKGKRDTVLEYFMLCREF
jgi:hypothetical protein